MFRTLRFVTLAVFALAIGIAPGCDKPASTSGKNPANTGGMDNKTGGKMTGGEKKDDKMTGGEKKDDKAGDKKDEKK